MREAGLHWNTELLHPAEGRSFSAGLNSKDVVGTVVRSDIHLRPAISCIERKDFEGR